jgi:hypothetical protein
MGTISAMAASELLDFSVHGEGNRRGTLKVMDAMEALDLSKVRVIKPFISLNVTLHAVLLCTLPFAIHPVLLPSAR